MGLSRTALLDYTATKRPEFERLLKAFVEIPSISADPGRKADLERCARLGAETLRSFGASVETYTGEGPPVILGRFHSGKDWPIVTIYNHLDVVAASKEDEPWNTEPFQFTKRGDAYFGRGTTDNKGPALSALFGAHAALDAGVPVNINVLWELEEEIGSPHFADTLWGIGPAVASEAVVVSDTQWVSNERPTQSAGLRGLQAMNLRLETGRVDQHSGTTGGVARNPIAELAQLVADLLDARTGRVKVPGFYDDVEEVSSTELEGFRASGFDLASFKKTHEFTSLRTKDPLEALKRLWVLPTMEVHGLGGGYTGPGVKTIVPPRAELKLSMRLVPNMSGEKIVRLLEAFIKERNPDVQVEAPPAAPPFKGVTTGPYFDAARQALNFAFGKEPAVVREGGTIGAILSMERALKCPMVFMGLSLPEHGFHAPNEHYDWGQASGGILAFAKFFEGVAERGTTAAH